MITLTRIDDEPIQIDPKQIIETESGWASSGMRQTSLKFRDGSSVFVFENLLEIMEKTEAVGVHPPVVPLQTTWIW